MDTLPIVNVALGQLPVSVAITPSNSAGTAVVGVGDELVALVTTTYELQEALSIVASVAPHVRAVAPTGNREPDAGTQVDEMGAVPPEMDGANVTATGFPLGEVAEGAGHITVSASADDGGGGLSDTGVCPHTSADGGLITPAEL